SLANTANNAMAPDANGEFVGHVAHPSYTTEDRMQLLGGLEGEPAVGVLVLDSDLQQLFRLDGATAGGKRIGALSVAALLVKPDGVTATPYFPTANTDAAKTAAIRQAED